jgi:hypothetical protein
MARNSKPKAGKATTVAMKRARSRADVIGRTLSKMPEIDAVFLLNEDGNVVHVFSVVREFESKIYDKLLKKERAIEKGLPEIALEFHVRAHQGRAPAQSVPFEAKLVYAR